MPEPAPVSRQAFTAHGLTIHSEVALPEHVTATPPSQPADVVFRLGAVPDEAPAFAAQVRSATRDRCVLDLRATMGVRYDVIGGSEVVVRPEPDADPRDVWLWLMGPALAVLLHQRGVLALHANTVVVDDRALAIAGDSGAGKSTLTAALLRDPDVRLMTDDVTTIRLRDGAPWVAGSVPELKLLPASAALVGVDLAAAMVLDRRTGKAVLDTADRHEPGPLPLTTIVVLSVADDPDLEVRELRGIDRVSTLLPHLSRPELMGPVADHVGVFDQLTATAAATTVVAARRPHDGDTLDRLVAGVTALHAQSGASAP